MSFLTDKKLELLQEKYCGNCGTQRCTGMFDEVYREGCLFYVNANSEAEKEFDEHIKQLKRNTTNLRMLH